MNDTTNTSYDYLSAPLTNDGEMNAQGVMNVSLSFFGLHRNIVDDRLEKEVILFKQTLPIAIRFCASLSDWSFLVKSVDYEVDDIINDEPVPYEKWVDAPWRVKGDVFLQNGRKYFHSYRTYKDYTYGYKLPSDFMKVRYIDDDIRIGYAVRGRELYCDFKGIKLDYISDRMDAIPVEFAYLVAYRCAIEMSNHLDPEGTAFQRATSSLQQVFTILKAKDDDAIRLQNPAQNHYVDIDSTYWGYKA